MKRNPTFPAGGERERVLRLLWPTYVHIDQIVAQINAIPEGRPVTKTTVRSTASGRMRLSRPFTRGRWSREAAIKEMTHVE